MDIVGRGLLGLTIACARCHDHKFDPVGTEDYYALAGVFASTTMFNRPLSAEVEKADASQKDNKEFENGKKASGEAKDGHKPEEVEQGIYDNIEKLKQEDVPSEELQKVKNNFAASEYRIVVVGLKGFG